MLGIRTMHRNIGLFIAAWAGLLLVTGCVSTITLKVVDAATGHPLAGVDTVWRQDSYNLFFGAYHYGPTNLAPSTEDGVIMVDGIHNGDANEFIFSRNGYGTLYGRYLTGGLFTQYHASIFTLANHTNAVYSQTFGFVLEGPLSNVSPTNGVIVVHMHPLENAP